MTALPADLEALMPEPVGRIYGYVSGRARIEWFRRPGNNGDAVFTADQVREAILATNERAAKLCEQQADDHTEFKNTQAAIGCDGCAAAIRGTS